MKYNFKRRMGEMEGMLMTYNFESMWQWSTTVINPETSTLIRYKDTD